MNIIYNQYRMISGSMLIL